MRAKLFLFLGVFVMLSIASCQKSNYNVDEGSTSTKALAKKNNDKGGGGKGKNNGDDNDNNEDPAPITYEVTYQLSEVDDHDPLYRFSISTSGQLMLFETDPNITSWGTDYWGYWSSPYSYSNGQVVYIIGLTHTTYTFTQIDANSIDVSKTVISTSYTGGTSTTTVTHPGKYVITP